MPYRGAASSAGEWGHLAMRVGGRQCRCGARGCLEAYVGAQALPERWWETGRTGRERAGAGLLLAPGCCPPYGPPRQRTRSAAPSRAPSSNRGSSAPKPSPWVPRPCRRAGSRRSVGTGTYPRERIVSGPR
ncbi:ROK family protein [Streptomyces paromomycinus]|uniref:ROK family protein n=1 Tax=Streptomyces paromomycinus TaxID=92743 RepID=UPI003530E077